MYYAGHQHHTIGCMLSSSLHIPIYDSQNLTQVCCRWNPNMIPRDKSWPKRNMFRTLFGVLIELRKAGTMTPYLWQMTLVGFCFCTVYFHAASYNCVAVALFKSLPVHLKTGQHITNTTENIYHCHYQNIPTVRAMVQFHFCLSSNERLHQQQQCLDFAFTNSSWVVSSHSSRRRDPQ